ncbi:MAG: heme exporter protein CcmB [Candidatus Dormibacteraceae bacterium]
MRRFANVAVAVALKDLRAEWRSRELIWALAQFGILALLIANFGFDINHANAGEIAPGILWLTIVFAGLVGFGRAFGAEREQASLEAMLLTAAPAAAIFAGKAIASALFLVACEFVVVLGLGLFFSIPVASWALVGAILLATVGMAAVGCLFSGLAAQTRARDLLLPVLTLPVWIPLVVAGGRAVQVAMGAPGSSSGAVGLLLDFDILLVVATSLAARFVLDE